MIYCCTLSATAATTQALGPATFGRTERILGSTRPSPGVHSLDIENRENAQNSRELSSKVELHFSYFAHIIVLCSTPPARNDISE